MQKSHDNLSAIVKFTLKFKYWWQSFDLGRSALKFMAEKVNSINQQSNGRKGFQEMRWNIFLQLKTSSVLLAVNENHSSQLKVE